MDREEQDRLSERLREAVERTKATYEISKRDFEKAKDLALHNSDGAYSLFQALRQENHALFNYKRALARFNRFILDGELPEEPDLD